MPGNQIRRGERETSDQSAAGRPRRSTGHTHRAEGRTDRYGAPALAQHRSFRRGRLVMTPGGQEGRRMGGFPCFARPVISHPPGRAGGSSAQVSAQARIDEHMGEKEVDGGPRSSIFPAIVRGGQESGAQISYPFQWPPVPYSTARLAAIWWYCGVLVTTATSIVSLLLLLLLFFFVFRLLPSLRLARVAAEGGGGGHRNTAPEQAKAAVATEEEPEHDSLCSGQQLGDVRCDDGVYRGVPCRHHPSLAVFRVRRGKSFGVQGGVNKGSPPSESGAGLSEPWSPRRTELDCLHPYLFVLVLFRAGPQPNTGRRRKKSQGRGSRRNSSSSRRGGGAGRYGLHPKTLLMGGGSQSARKYTGPVRAMAALPHPVPDRGGGEREMNRYTDPDPTSPDIAVGLAVGPRSPFHHPGAPIEITDSPSGETTGCWRRAAIDNLDLDSVPPSAASRGGGTRHRSDGERRATSPREENSFARGDSTQAGMVLLPSSSSVALSGSTCSQVDFNVCESVRGARQKQRGRAGPWSPTTPARRGLQRGGRDAGELNSQLIDPARGGQAPKMSSLGCRRRQGPAGEAPSHETRNPLASHRGWAGSPHFKVWARRVLVRPSSSLQCLGDVRTSIQMPGLGGALRMLLTSTREITCATCDGPLRALRVPLRRRRPVPTRRADRGLPSKPREPAESGCAVSTFENPAEDEPGACLPISLPCVAPLRSQCRGVSPAAAAKKKTGSPEKVKRRESTRLPKRRESNYTVPKQVPGRRICISPDLTWATSRCPWREAVPPLIIRSTVLLEDGAPVPASLNRVC
ncbi:unnamed protein product [Diplocarpon coronariae]